MNGLFTNALRFRKVLLGRDFYISKQINLTKKKFGNINASWTIIDESLTSDSVVYSFGVGTDISFDLEMINHYNTIIHAFDPTPKSIQWLKTQKISDKFVFHPFGIASKNGKIDLYLPQNEKHVSGSILPEMISASSKLSVEVFDLLSIMNMLNHNYIDILKMDIEGAEYDVIQNIIDSKLKIKQILIEFHHRFPAIGIKKTRQAIKILNDAGYKIFDVSPSGEEFSFIKS
jgi:FkbM family methyltransferase